MTEVLHFVDGSDMAGEGDEISVTNPATEKEIGRMREATPDQVRSAVAAARAAFAVGKWSAAPMTHRRAVLRAMAGAIRDAAPELVALQVAEVGTPQSAARAQIAGAAGWFDYFADFLTTDAGRSFAQIEGATTLVERVPMGVCALFSPWNVPVGLTAIKLAPALAAGNSVVVKPSELSPMVTRRLIELILSAGLPDGVLNLVNGRGAVTGAALAEADGVDFISFTGGSEGGRAVSLAAAARQVPTVMELGGKSATIVFADAPLDRAVPAAAMSVFGNNGQACLSGSRILVDAGILESFMREFKSFAEDLKVGNPADESVAMGPLISGQHRKYVMGFLEGAEVICGGPMPGPGHFVRPGAIHVRDFGARIWREEVFGPIAAIAGFETEEEAIARANDSAYGLAGYLWTRDLGRAHRVSKALRTGTVIVNSSFRRELNAPFGGFGASGHGREGGLASWYNVTQARSTVIDHG